jgi:hypothetical protein
MIPSLEKSVTVFVGDQQLAHGSLGEVLPAIKQADEAGELVQAFDDASARQLELDLRGSLEDVIARFPTPEAKGRGRPKLGVTPREVTLMPRHWDWLASQSGGASVVLRKLIEEAMRSPAAEKRLAQEVTYRFMMAKAGNQPGLDEANRALFAGDRAKFMRETSDWPPAIRDYALRQAASAF